MAATTGAIVLCATALSAGLHVPSCAPAWGELEGYACPNAPAALAFVMDREEGVISETPCIEGTLFIGDGPDAWTPGNIVPIKRGGQRYLLHYFAPKDGHEVVLLEPLLEA